MKPQWQQSQEQFKRMREQQEEARRQQERSEQLRRQQEQLREQQEQLRRRQMMYDWQQRRGRMKQPPPGVEPIQRTPPGGVGRARPAQTTTGKPGFPEETLTKPRAALGRAGVAQLAYRPRTHRFLSLLMLLLGLPLTALLGFLAGSLVAAVFPSDLAVWAGAAATWLLGGVITIRAVGRLWRGA